MAWHQEQPGTNTGWRCVTDIRKWRHPSCRICASPWRHHTGPMAGQTRYCCQCQVFFFQLRQLRRVRRSLDDASVGTFVTSRVDYCNCLLAGATKASLDKLQRVMNAAARVVSDTHKFDHGLTSIRRNDLHWLDGRPWACHVQTLCLGLQVSARHSTAILVWTVCRQTHNIEGRRQLRSATRGDLEVRRCRQSTCGRLAFSALAHQHGTLYLIV